MKKYNKAPLPFQGQKRNYLKIFNRELQKLCGDGTGWTIVDVFGGSGLLSHNAKYTCPNARVVYNDYDNYTKRLSKTKKTEQLRQILRELIGDKGKDTQLAQDTKIRVIELLKNNEYIDYITLSSYLLFAGNYIHSIDELETRQFYNRVSKSPINADGYLNGVETVHKCFTEIMTDKFDGNVLYLLDPPYINTQQGYHRDKNNYFGLLSQLALFELMKPIKSPFFYFTSSKSEVSELTTNMDCGELSQLFSNSNSFSVQNLVNNVGRYTDILIIKTTY